MTTPAPDDARRRREQAADLYRPADVRLLLVAEAPPSALDRYFYFEDVREHDSLFRYVARAITGQEPTRANKAELLAQLRDRGVFLIDLKQDPADGSLLANEVDGLLERIGSIDPRRIILIKSSVYDAAFHRLRQAGLPVVDERVPFPGSGQQRRFEEAFARALAKANRNAPADLDSQRVEREVHGVPSPRRELRGATQPPPQAGQLERLGERLP